MEMMMVHGRRDEQYGQHHHHHRHLGLGLGLGLSLSLGVAGGAADEPPRRGVAPPPQQLCGWNGAAGLFSSSSSDRRTMMAYHDVEMPFLRGIDVNRAPVETTTARGASCSEEDEEPGASSPNSTLSSLSGKRGAPSAACRSEAATAAAGSDDEDSGGGGGGSRKKLRLSKDQAAVLEDTFKEHNTLNPKQKAALARQLNLKPRQVEVWFQNRRARTKLKQTEVDCELLKRCCETLTDENRRLHRELSELRALKLAAAAAPHLYARVPPPTTLTMCPSCERIASTTHNSGAGEVVAPARPVPTRPWPAAAAQRSSA